jgi:Pin2-interacting protein X1
MGLAGPKQKQRFGQDPQNKNWQQDKTAVGFTLLSKMGWQEGHGIGKSEEGRTENIKVSLKLNNYGIGADAKTSDNWLENTFAFDEMLKGMENDQDSTLFIMPEQEATKTEEKKPKNGRHAHRKKVRHSYLIVKFIKNKDVKQFQSAQVNNILGKTRECLVVDKGLDKETEPPGPVIENAQMVVSTIAVGDYFAAKMRAKGLSLQTLTSGTPISHLESEEQTQIIDPESIIGHQPLLNLDRKRKTSEASQYENNIELKKYQKMAKKK